MNQKAASPGKIALMAAGVLLAVVFAGWNINRALTPPAPPAVKAAAAGAPAAAAAAAPAAPDPHAEAAPRPRAGFSREAVMAPAADPFTQLPPAVARQLAPPQAPAYTAPPAYAPPQQMAVRAMTQAGMGPVGLPSVGPGVATPMPPAGGPAATLMAEPALIGTLTGDRPSAVFGGKDRLEIVPVGRMYGIWRVVSVSHGSAMVRCQDRTVRLSVGGSGAAAGRISQARPEDAAERIAEASPQAPGYAQASASARPTEPEPERVAEAAPAAASWGSVRTADVAVPQDDAAEHARQLLLHPVTASGTGWNDASASHGRLVVVARSAVDQQVTEVPASGQPEPMAPAAPVRQVAMVDPAAQAASVVSPGSSTRKSTRRHRRLRHRHRSRHRVVRHRRQRQSAASARSRHHTSSYRFGHARQRTR